ncbi:phasin family protein [Methylobacterium sp. WSM2598]|uniref:phasin family protein n=1 Tax=Methylobacterium sp. WSM2598 TaxID=398261 RepID=UPI0004768A6A|nr:phasin family protein [Methylobacterium sp. WSM2598]
MIFNHNNNNGNQYKMNESIVETASANIDKAAEQGGQFVDAARDRLNQMSALREQVSENTKQIVQRCVETAAQQAREAGERFTKTLGFTGEDSERPARQSNQNVEAVTRCGTVLTQAFQDASRSWFELSQKQWQRNLDGLSKLARARSVQEFVTIQSELVREGLQHIVQDSRTITATSARAIEDASKTFSSMAQQSSTAVR